MSRSKAGVRPPRAQARIAVVGGGIAGLYCAWQLALEHRDWQISLFESLPRLGGRIETQQLGGFNAEFGPMRFEPQIQPLFRDLCKELKVKTEPFPLPSSDLSTPVKYKLSPDELAGDGKPLSTLSLLGLGVQRLCGKDLEGKDLVANHEGRSEVPAPSAWKWLQRIPIDEFEAEMQRLRSTKLIETDHQGMQGDLLYRLGFWNAISGVLSYPAVTKIKDTGTFYHLLPDNPNAAEWVVFWLRLFRATKPLVTIPEGVETIVAQLDSRLRGLGVNVYSQHEVRGLQSAESGAVHLEVDCPDHVHSEPDVTFDHVVLALPKLPLQRLSRTFPSDVLEHLEDVSGLPLLKAFLVTSNPWWRGMQRRATSGDSDKVKQLKLEGYIPLVSQLNAGRAPTRELHYYLREDGRNTTGMVMLYTDHPANEYWKTLLKDPSHHTRAEVHENWADNPPLAGTLTHYLMYEKGRELRRQSGTKELVSVDQETAWDKLIAYGIRDWSKPPFGAAFHCWNPGVESWEVRKRLTAFGLRKGHRDGNVHICGEAYSDYQAFVEGALRSAAEVVSLARRW